jgi:hypothetical protein
MPRKSAAKKIAPGAAAQSSTWRCPKCGRSFTQKNQRHACGTGDRGEVLRNRPDGVVRLYGVVERFAKSLGGVEIVARERYVLLRTHRIFADLVIMTDAVRIAIHLKRKLDDPIFFKVGGDGKKVTHVAKLISEADFAAVRGYLKEAYECSLESTKS